jgi:hypothetical protein
MDCLRTAKFSVSFTESFVFGSETFTLKINSKGVSVGIDLNSKFQIQGFKNVDVYGFKFIPSATFIDANYYTVGTALTFIWENSYELTVNFDGTIDLIGGINVLSGTVNQSTKNCFLNNFVPEVMLTSPIQSCQSIDFGSFKTTFPLIYANTTAAAGHNMAIDVSGDLYVYYKFEGE